MAYTIKSIDAATGNITVSFDYDNIDQILGDKTLDDAAILKQELADYEAAYVAGREAETAIITPSADVEALIGQVITEA